MPLEDYSHCRRECTLYLFFGRKTKHFFDNRATMADHQQNGTSTVQGSIHHRRPVTTTMYRNFLTVLWIAFLPQTSSFCARHSSGVGHPLHTLTIAKRFVVADPEAFEDFIQEGNQTFVAKESQVVKRRPKKLPFYTGLRYLLEVSRGRHPQYQYELQLIHGDCYIIWDTYVTLANADAIRDVLETYNLEKPPDLTESLKVMFFPTGGILAAPWNEWIKQRRMTTPALAEAVIGKLAPKFQQAAAPMFELLEDAAASQRVVEMDGVFTAMTMDTIGLITLGRTFGMLDSLLLEEQDPQAAKNRISFRNAIQVISADAIRQTVSPRWVLKFWKPSRKVLQAKAEIDFFLEDCIDRRLKALQEERDQPDLLNILLDAENDGAISRDDLKAQLITFIFAGYDTTAHTLTFMLYEIAIDKQLQADIAAEVTRALSERQDFPLDPSIVNNHLPLLDCAWLETLRKHPAAASGPARVVGPEPIVVGDGLEIPAGVNINIPPYGLHRNTEYWSDPEVFDCSRWTAKERTKRGDTLSFIPFSAGARSCLGSRLARLEALSAMASLFRRFEVTCVETREPIPFTSLTTKPRDGIRFSFQARG